MNSNDLKLSGRYSYRKDPKKMSIEELEQYLADKTKQICNSNIMSNIPQSYKNTQNANESSNGFSNSPQKKNYTMSLMGNSPIEYSVNDMSMQVNSKAVSDYLKCLQDKIQFLLKENKELKENFINVREILNAERDSKRNQRYNINKNYNDENIQSENRRLIEENNELKNQIKIIKEQFNLFEKEKQRHLEQSIKEKEILQNTIVDLKSQIKSLQSQILLLNNNIQIQQEQLQQREKGKRLKKAHSKEKEAKKNIKSNLLFTNQHIKVKVNRSASSKSPLHVNPHQIKSTKIKMTKSRSKKRLTRNSSVSKIDSKDIINKTLHNYINKKQQKEKNIFQDKNIKINLAHMDSIDRLVSESTNNYFSSSQNSTKSNPELNHINSQIQILEANIEQLKINYQNLSQKLELSNNQSKLTQINDNLNLITRNLEDKSYKLLTLRKQQQEILKNSLCEINIINNNY